MIGGQIWGFFLFFFGLGLNKLCTVVRAKILELTREFKCWLFLISYTSVDKLFRLSRSALPSPVR